MTGLHRDRVIPKENSANSKKGATATKKSRRIYAILRKTRWFFVVGIGGLLANSYFKVVFTKQIYTGPLKSVCVPFLNCHACPTAVMSCPIGMIQHFAAIQKIPFLILGYLGLIGILFGRSACGWLCPFGWVQDILYKIKSRKFQIPKFLTRFKYISLIILAILLPLLTEAHWFSRICPWGTIIAGIPWVLWNPIDPTYSEPVIEPGMVGWKYALKIGILILFLILFILTKRPFCRTTCPLGAIYSLFNKFSLMKMRVQSKCVDCALCKKVCPVDIQISQNPDSAECIRCVECTVCKNVSVKWSVSDESGQTKPA